MALIERPEPRDSVARCHAVTHASIDPDLGQQTCRRATREGGAGRRECGRGAGQRLAGLLDLLTRASQRVRVDTESAHDPPSPERLYS